MIKLSLEASGGPSRALWFILGGVSGFIFAISVALRTLYSLLSMGEP